MAWLRAVPSDDNWEKGVSRLKYLEDRDRDIHLPDISGVELVVTYLAELGYADQGFDSLKPVAWSEIQAWANMTGLTVQTWLALMLRELSEEYATQANRSREASCPAPFTVEATESEIERMRKRSDAKVRKLFEDG